MEVSKGMIDVLEQMPWRKSTLVRYYYHYMVILEMGGLIMHQQDTYFITSLGRIKLAEIKEKQ